MNIKWFGANANNYTVGRSGATIKKIVIHWIVGTLESADATFANPDRKASAHYGIGDTDIHQYVDEKDTAWHASNWILNTESIGIEHEGGWLLQDGTRAKPSEQTHETSAQLVADICRRHSIPIDREHIRLHNESSATTCPGTLDVNKIIERAKVLSTPTPTPTPTPPTVTGDQTKIDLGGLWGVMELQAIRSTLNDQKNNLASSENSCKDRIKQAVDTAIIENDKNWQAKMESANATIEKLKLQTAENIDWKTLMSIAWKKFWIAKKAGGK
jgi:N-acetylmuramoyl-L-alanine amidase CwlA